MFYGLNDSKRNVDDNERKKFMPWNSTERFGGKITFTIEEKKFEIERFFGKKASDDTMKLTDLSTGISHEENSDWGKRIFKVDEDGFLSTTFFSQKDLQTKDSHSIVEKYNESCEVEQSEQFEKAIVKLENKIKTYSYSGGRGLIPQTENEIFNFKNQLELQNTAKFNAEQIKTSILEVQNEISTLKEKSNDLSLQWEKACKSDAIRLKIQQYTEIDEQIKLEQDKILQAQEVLENNEVSTNTLNQYAQCVSDLELANQKAEILNNDILTLKKQVENLSNTISSTQKFKTANSTFNLLLILSICLAIGGILICAFLSLIAGVIAITIGVVGAICCLILNINRNSNKKNDTDNGLIAILSLLEEKNTKLREINEICEKYNLVLSEFFNKFNILNSLSYVQKLEIIEKSVNQKENSIEQKEKLIAKLTKVEQELLEMGYDIAHICPNDYIKTDVNNNANQIKFELEQVDKKINQLENQIVSQRIKLNAYELDGEKALETTIRINELSEKLNEYKEQLKLYSLTLEYFKKADVNLKIKYREPLINALNKYLKYIANDNIVGSIDVNLKMTIDEFGLSKETDFYSKGYKDLFEICKRFALIEILFTDEKPFVLLDDPFCNLDERKIENALKLLKQLSSEFQLIYFVCHKSRSFN